MSELKVQSILISEIDDAVRLRPLNQAAARKLTLSMQKEAEGGVKRHQINPVTVRAKAAGGFILVTGAHRLAAARLLGWKEINAIVTEMSDEDASEAEVDENLYRADLSEADLSLFVTKKLEFYTYSGGKMKRGRRSIKSAKLADLPHDAHNSKEKITFYNEIEAKFGIKRRTAERLIRRGRNISPRLWEEIRSGKNAVPGGLLDKLAELPEEARDEVERLVVEQGKSLAQAVKTYTPEKETEKQTPQAVAHRLASIWSLWSTDDRALFIKLLKNGGRQ